MTTPQDPDDGAQRPYTPPSDSAFTGEPGSAGGPAMPPVPREVQISFWIWIAGAVLSIVGVLLAFTQRDSIEEALRRTPDATRLSPEEFNAAVNATLLFTVVFGVVFAGLYVLFAFKARAGRNWARVVLTVLTALMLVTLVFGASVSGILTGLMSAVAVFLLYTRNSNAYFDAVKRAR